MVEGTGQISHESPVISDGLGSTVVDIAGDFTLLMEWPVISDLKAVESSTINLDALLHCQ